MPTQYEDVRDQIYTIVSGITNIGKVYRYQRVAKETVKYLDFFKTTIGGKTLIRGWTITSPSMSQFRLADTGQHSREIIFILRGWNQVEDTGDYTTTAETVFRTLAETIVDTLDAKPTLNGKTRGSEPAQLESFQEVWFGDVLCHRVEIKLVYRTTKQITYS